MDSNRTFQLMTLFRDKLSSKQNLYISEKLKNTDNEAFQELIYQPYKKVSTALLLGFFLGIFGGNRLYIGNKAQGIFRLIFGCILMAVSTFMFSVGTLFAVLSGGQEPFMSFYAVSIIVLVFTLLFYLLYCFIDIFLCVISLKKRNFKMILNVIEKYPLKEELNPFIN